MSKRDLSGLGQPQLRGEMGTITDGDRKEAWRRLMQAKAELVGVLAQEDVRKKAWQLVQAKADGHEMSPGVAELIDELADTLNRSAGWKPGDVWTAEELEAAKLRSLEMKAALWGNPLDRVNTDTSVWPDIDGEVVE